MFSKSEKNQSELPSRARAASTVGRSETGLNKPIHSSNTVYKVKKIKYEVNSDKESDSEDRSKKTKLRTRFSTDHNFYFKEHHNPRIAELESYCASICRYLAPAFVPSVRPYYNDNHEIIASASQGIANFRSNFENPLHKEDLVINSPHLMLEQQQRILMRLIGEVTKTFKKNNFIRDAYNSVSDRLFSASNLKGALLYLQTCPKRFTEKNLHNLLAKIEKRIAEIDFKKTPKLVEEINRLVDITLTIKKILTLKAIKEEQPLTVEMLEAIDQMQQQQGSQLEDLEAILEYEIGGLTIKINAACLKNYRIIKGLAIYLTTQFIINNNDNNNSNFSKEGYFFDLDWAKSDILAQFKSLNLSDELWQKISKKALPCTPENIKHFPDLEEKNLIYWPTKQPEFYKILIEFISGFLLHCRNLKVDDDRLVNLVLELTKQLEEAHAENRTYYEYSVDLLSQTFIKVQALMLGKDYEELWNEEKIHYLFSSFNQRFLEMANSYDNILAQTETTILNLVRKRQNAFTKDDNSNFKKLATHPVFIFHKYKTLLKYILTDESLYKSFAGLNIRNTPCINKEGEEINLSNLMVEDDIRNLHEFRATLTSLNDFKEFLEQHGIFAFELIKKECVEYKEHYEQKLEEKPYYEQLVEAIDEEMMEERFHATCAETKTNLNFPEKIVRSSEAKMPL